MGGINSRGESPMRRPESERLGVLMPGDKTPEQKAEEQEATRILRRDLLHGVLKLTFGLGLSKVVDRVLGSGNDKDSQVSSTTSPDSDVKIVPLGKQKP